MSDGKPIDLLVLAREANAAETRELAAQTRIDSIQLIRFEPNRDPGRSLPVGRHPKNNRVVFPDQKRCGGTIKPGETYFCDLIEYRPPAGPAVYYANPIKRVDATYLFELQASQVDALVEALSRSAHAELVEKARAQIEFGLQARAPREVDALRAEAAALRDENLTLKEQMSHQSGTQATDSVSPQLHAELPATVVSRPAADELRSPLLPAGRYFVHVSPDRAHLFIHGHPEGTLSADGSGLRIPGLSILRPFDRAEDLLARPDRRVGGLCVEIGGRNHVGTGDEEQVAKLARPQGGSRGQISR